LAQLKSVQAMSRSAQIAIRSPVGAGRKPEMSVARSVTRSGVPPGTATRQSWSEPEALLR
jgi:hypothetical protein